MERNVVQLPYDLNAERTLTRVALLRSGVPQRVLDARLPATRPSDPAAGKRATKPSSIRFV